MFSNQTQSINICHICGGEIERERNKSCPTASGEFGSVTHILSTLHQQTSLSQCLSWTNSEKRRAVVIRKKGTALKPEGILQRIGSRVGFEKLTNLILIPEYPSPIAAILLFVDSYDLESIWRYADAINYFRRLLTWNLEDVLRATTFSSAEWMKLLSPKKQELWPKPNSEPETVPKLNFVNRCSTLSTSSTNTNFLTSNDIKSMISVTILHTLNQFCSFNNWSPPIFQVNEITTTKTVYSLDVIVNEKTYKTPGPTLDKAFAARFCLLRFLSEFTFPTKDELYDCDSYKIKLKKFVEQRGLTMSDFKIYREVDLHPLGRIYYYSISVNAQCYKSPVSGTTRHEGEYFAAFYCLEELKRRECASTSSSKRQRPSVSPQRPTETMVFPSTSTSVQQSGIGKPISFPENRQLEDDNKEVENENSENVSSSADDDDDSLIVSESGSESDAECGEEIEFSDDHDDDHDHNDEMDESDDDEVEVMEVCEISTHLTEKESDTEITVLGEPKNLEEIYLSDDSDIDEIVVLKKGEDSEGKMETNAKVKVEESVTPWPTIYIPSDYVNEKFEKSDDVLEQICLVCGWKRPVYINNLESMSDQPNRPVEERFSFRLSVNGREYKTERLEKTKAKAKEKVARICLLELCHHGQIPHPSIFQNISLDSDIRLRNLSRCRELVLGEDLKAKHTIIHHKNKYVCNLQFNGKKYSKGGTTYNEAKLKAASLCLKRLCKENVANVFAHGSITFRTKNDLTYVANEISVGPVRAANKKVKSLSRQFHDTLAKMTIKENELEQSKKLLTALEDFLNKELSINVTLMQFRNSVPHIRNHCTYKKLHIDICLKPTNSDDDTQNLVHDVLVVHREKNLFPGVKAKVLRVVDEIGPKSRSISGTKFKILSKAGLTWLPDSFSVHMYNYAKAKLEMCRFVDYMTTFDPRFVPLLVIVRHWAEVNKVNFFKKSKLKVGDVFRNYEILDWLVLCYLAGLKIIPIPRTILERPRTKSTDESGITNPDKYKLFEDDPQFANQWRSSNYKGPEENSSAFSLQIFLLAKYFFSYFGKSLQEGNWILNTRDAELIYAPDFFKGSFITELTPYDLDKLRDMQINGKNLMDQTHKLVIVHPGLKSKWKIVVESKSRLSGERVFKKMAKSGERPLQTLLASLQKEGEGETATN